MEDKSRPIIIKRVKKGHGGHHGGSWKVAYADFVTAMMAFFLLMWLLNMTSQEKRAVMALYFKHFSLFTQSGKSFMMTGGTKPAFQAASGNELVDASEDTGGISKDESLHKIVTSIQEHAQVDKANVFTGASEEGIRIQIVDTLENPIFPPGSAQMTDHGKRILHSISALLRNFPNELAIEGHTDGSPIRSEQTSNWELSTARASAARREVEANGIPPKRIARVVGFADKVPLIKESPEDSRNRRISIVFLKMKRQKPEEQFDWLWKKPAPQT